MNFKSSIIVWALTVTLGGCALFSSQPTYAPVDLQTQFLGTEHSAYLANGQNTIKGQVILHNDNGGVINCSGNEVLLLPVTPYFREVISHIRKGHQVNYTKNISSAYSQIVKKTYCDAEGNFSFSGLPLCTWFIVTRTAWLNAGIQQGGTLVHELKSCPSTPLVMDNVDIAGP